MVNYYMAAKLPISFGEALERTEDALKQEGFGIISRIDIQEALKTKIMNGKPTLRAPIDLTALPSASLPPRPLRAKSLA